MKTTKKFNGLRVYVALAVVFFFASFFVACHELDPIEPVTFAPVVKTVSLTKLTPASVEVKSEIISDGGEAITAAGICWIASVSSIDPTVQNNLIIATVKSGAYTTTVSNLQQKVAYSFRAYATNKNGTAYGETVNFYDGSVIIPVKAVVVAKQATKVTMTSATIAAVIVPNEKDTKASFEWHEIHDGLWTIIDLDLGLESKNPKDSLKLSSTISGLDPGKIYSYRLRATNGAGEVVSAESTFTTYAVADLDGNMYHEIQIGDQIWLQENLRTTKYANGDPISNVTNPIDWGKLTTGAYCWYNNDPELGKVYGGLYNFYVGVDSRKLIKGYHVPTGREWDELGTYTMSTHVDQSVGPELMETGAAHWLNPPSYINNSTGFTALPNGALAPEKISNKFIFMNIEEVATYWTPELFGPGAVAVCIGGRGSFGVGLIYGQTLGLGLRLIKDE